MGAKSGRPRTNAPKTGIAPTDTVDIAGCRRPGYAQRLSRVQSTNVDTLLLAVILFGILLSVANLAVTLINARYSQMAEIKASANMRELYERAYKRGRRLVSIPRIGKVERRKAPGESSD